MSNKINIDSNRFHQNLICTYIYYDVCIIHTYTNKYRRETGKSESKYIRKEKRKDGRGIVTGWTTEATASSCVCVNSYMRTFNLSSHKYLIHDVAYIFDMVYLWNTVLFALRRVCHKARLQFGEGFGLWLRRAGIRRLGSRRRLSNVVVNACWFLVLLTIRGRSLCYILHLYLPDESYDTKVSFPCYKTHTEHLLFDNNLEHDRRHSRKLTPAISTMADNLPDASSTIYMIAYDSTCHLSFSVAGNFNLLLHEILVQLVYDSMYYHFFIRVN